MRLSKYYIPTIKEAPSDALAISNQLMLRSGMIRQLSNGLYTIMPIGMRVLHKITSIIRQELNAIGAMEVNFPIIQMNDAWIRSGRQDGYCGPETLRMKDRHDRDMLFSPTAEESAHLIFEMDVKSYKQLPINLYQINTKFRDEIRPRFGLMRCREFLMLDSYSFDLDEVSAVATYNQYFIAYLKMFQRMGLVAVPMRAATGEIGGDLSHEFHVIAQTGESAIFYDKKLDDIRQNLINYDITEIQNIYAKTEDEHNEENCPILPEDLSKQRGIEVGHIFYYAQKYSKAMNIAVQNQNGQQINPHGGCYGIGVTRLMAAAIESSHDDKGIIWHEEISPFDINLINLSPRDENAIKRAEEIYNSLIQQGLDVLYDDTEASIGFKLNNADLIGIPKQIIIGTRGLQNGTVEIKDRKSGTMQEVSIESLLSYQNAGY